jgi:outer membrane protein assembly factor BamB
MPRPDRLVRFLALPVALAALLAVAAPAAAAPGDWWQFGVTATNTSFNPNETTIDDGNVARLRVAAEHLPVLGQTGANAKVATAAAVANGTAYVNAYDFETQAADLLAYDPQTLAVRWRRSGVGCERRSPTVHLGIVYLGGSTCEHSSGDGAVRAFDGATGAPLWAYTGNEDVGSVTATGGVVYFSAWSSLAETSNDLLAVDAVTGQQRWHVHPAEITGKPAVAGGRLYVKRPGVLEVRASATGALLRSVPVGEAAASRTALVEPVVAGGVVYTYGLEAGAWKLFAVDAGSGAVRWSRALGGAPGEAKPAVAYGKVFVHRPGAVRAFDAATGAPRWTTQVADDNPAFPASPAVANGLVFVGLQRGIAAFRQAGGALLWRSGTIGYRDPVVAHGAVYAPGFLPQGGGNVAVVRVFRLGP